jgi:hypothetical protein
MNLNFVLPLTKVADGEQRLVYGRAAACVPDRSGEVMDWETGKSAIKEWSDSFSKITNGQSFGNVRLMHDSKRVVGKLVEMSFDDAAQAVDVVAHVVEDEAWKLHHRLLHRRLLLPQVGGHRNRPDQVHSKAGRDLPG